MKSRDRRALDFIRIILSFSSSPDFSTKNVRICDKYVSIWCHGGDHSKWSNFFGFFEPKKTSSEHLPYDNWWFFTQPVTSVPRNRRDLSVWPNWGRPLNWTALTRRAGNHPNSRIRTYTHTHTWTHHVTSYSYMMHMYIYIWLYMCIYFTKWRWIVIDRHASRWSPQVVQNLGMPCGPDMKHGSFARWRMSSNAWIRGIPQVTTALSWNHWRSHTFPS